MTLERVPEFFTLLLESFDFFVELRQVIRNSILSSLEDSDKKANRDV